MVGERYFAARERLLTCLWDIRALAEDAQVPKSEGEEESAFAALERPLRVVALGEVNAGKSTLLNAICGVELCPAGPLPTTQRTVHYCYGESEQDVEREDGWIDARRPLDFLRRIELIDTPGSNSGWRDSVMADGDRFGEADLILMVFPSENTWTAATWDLVSAMSEEALDRVLLVVQRADEKTVEDLRVIEGHMGELSVRKVERELPILAMSAELALESKISPETSRKGWSASRFSVFEEYLSRDVCDSSARRYVFDRTCQEASRLMRRIEDALDRQKRGMNDDGWFLTNLEREGNQLRDLVVDDAGRTLSGLRDDYEKHVMSVTRRFGMRLGAVRTMWGLLFGDSLAIRVEAMFAEGLQEIISSFARRDAARLVNECEGHWGEVRPRVIERMAMDPGESVLSGEAREAVIERLVTGVAKSVPTVLGQLRVRGALDVPLRHRNRRLKGLVAGLLVVLIAAGLCGTFGQDSIAYGLAIGAGVWALITLLLGWTSGRRLVRETRERLMDSEGRVETAMQRDYVESVCGLFAEHLNGLIGVRRQLADRQAALAPHSQRWDALYLRLKTIEQELEER